MNDPFLKRRLPATTSREDSTLLPIVLGVTGHRDIKVHHEIEVILSEHFQKIRNCYKNTPIVVLSALADGADRLFAKVALDLKLPLFVPLPMPIEDYKKTFASDGITEFEDLYNKATGVFTLPQFDPLCTRTCISQYHKELQYARLGLYIAQRSHILFALWDGKPARGLGGTAQVVEFHLHGRIQDLEDNQNQLEGKPHTEACPCGKVFRDTPSPLAWLSATEMMDMLGEPDSGLVCHIRFGRGETETSTERKRWRWGSGTAMKRSQKDHWFPDEGSYPGDDNLDALDDYNAKLTKVQPSSTADLPTRLFERADALAIQHLDHTRRYSIAIFVMALLTEIVPLGSDRFEFTAYFVLLLGMYWLVRIMHPKHTGKDIRKGKKGNENKESTDFRALAEGLRIQAAWQKAGVFDAVALRHLRHDHESLAWVRRALLGSALLGSGNNDLPLSAAREAIERVRSQWVESEASWFKKRYHQRHGQGGFWRKLRGTIPALDAIAWVLFWIGLLVAALALVLSWHPLQGVPPNVDDYLGLLHGLLPAWAAMFWVYLEFAEYREDADEYRRAAQLYWIANRRIEALRENEGDFPETRVVEAQRAVLHQLGIEALHENARWAHRHKSHDASITL